MCFLRSVYYRLSIKEKFESLIGAKVLRLFSDINIEEDIAMTVLSLSPPLS
ncbi:Na-translocating system protein MpsC family protein [Neobacillus kokaensis]|uniref:Na-translocating system protein MpsC family protein n=1 Tax=Neobacillus kokaensis TaxID=2759023 RepID=UPI00174D991D|nr:Na-translocating system protein MpsC family protein [Neobacillus kokaensis]